MKVVAIINGIIFLAISLAFSQSSITGTFPVLAKQYVKLVGFEGFNTYTIDSVKADENGRFKLNFVKQDYGMAYLAAEDNKSFIVVLDKGEVLNLTGESFAMAQSIQIITGEQNKIFEKYATEHPRREQTLSAWDYLEKIYSLDSLFASYDIPKQSILNEKQRIKAEDEKFLKNLNPESYLSWYLPVRKLVSSVSVIAQYRTSEIPAAVAAFRNMDYTDIRMRKSGLLRDAIEAHFWLLENSGRSLDSVFIEMNKSIDCIVENISKDEKVFNEVTGMLFKLLEQRSLFTSSEYLALKVLNEKSCVINHELSSQLESYRIMKKGNTAPDFDLKGDVLVKNYTVQNLPKKLSDIKADYYVVIFGASWCPACPGELSKVSEVYKKWKQYGVEVVFVSLDEEKKAFAEFASSYPFISFCDYKKWESPVFKSYYVFATPTIYLLDKQRKIILRPNSANQMDSWVDWFLVQGNLRK